MFAAQGLSSASVGQLFPVNSNILFKPHSSRRRHYLQGSHGSWQVCLHYPTCVDGLRLIPIDRKDCPNSSYIGSCVGSGAGQLCQAEGECLTPSTLGNCGNISVYRKEAGTSRTSTTSVTHTSTSITLTSTSSTSTTITRIWRLTKGPCQMRGDCLISPSYGDEDEPYEDCQVSLREPSAVNITGRGSATYRAHAKFYVDRRSIFSSRRWSTPWSTHRVGVRSTLLG